MQISRTYCGGVVGTPDCGGAGVVPFGACCGARSPMACRPYLRSVWILLVAQPRLVARRGALLFLLARGLVSTQSQRTGLRLAICHFRSIRRRRSLRIQLRSFRLWLLRQLGTVAKARLLLWLGIVLKRIVRLRSRVGGDLLCTAPASSVWLEEPWAGFPGEPCRSGSFPSCRASSKPASVSASWRCVVRRLRWSSRCRLVCSRRGGRLLPEGVCRLAEPGPLYLLLLLGRRGVYALKVMLGCFSAAVAALSSYPGLI